ncbi:DUF4350 domain-containing protein [Microcella sp.]|uniref:DUF4350 domain-containing protein n=1 Tax=Microcella sp. TaxID=1913979 RepID=UPI00256A5C83|nr:DUF4350 domain-containing protein [Microcella sp.]MBX9472769.1 DUF4350 domain-containing protein [Microcella sp.]
MTTTSATDYDTSVFAGSSTEIITPTVRRSLRRGLYWAVAIGALLAFGLVMVALNGAGRVAERWGAGETAPSGSRALVEVLRDQGIDVVVTSTLDESRSELEDLSQVDGGPGVTLFVGDARGILGQEQWGEVLGLADHTVIAEPTALALDGLGIDALVADSLDSGDPDAGSPVGDAGGRVTLDAGCRVPAAQRAESISAAGLGYSTLEGTICFDAGQAGAALVSLEVDGRKVTVLGAGTALQNDDITRAGNAALVLGLLGEHETLVWYQPSPADLSTPTFSELTPGWVNPVAWLALLVGLAAAVWRGRRLGPVVIENLPVVVKTTETMEGRARLYAREGSRLRALDALRVGTLRRLAEGLALGRAAGVDDIINAVAGITGRDPQSLRALLVGTEPGSDRDLVHLSDRLLELERQVAKRVALDDDSTTPPERMDS